MQGKIEVQLLWRVVLRPRAPPVSGDGRVVGTLTEEQRRPGTGRAEFPIAGKVPDTPVVWGNHSQEREGEKE